MFLLITFAAIALGISFLCSMLEASLLSIPSSHVAMLVERGSRFGRPLQEMKDRVDRPLAAILTLNTIAHTVGATGVGAEAARLYGHASVGIASAVMTVLILVLSEIIPKTLGAVNAKSLAGFTVITTRLMMIITYPIIVVLQWMSRLLGQQRQKEVLTRGEIIAAVRLGRQAGSLNTREYRTASNLMSLHMIKVSEILTPRTVLMALPEKRTVDQVIKEYSLPQHSRIPVYRETVDDVTGYITRYELMDAYRSGRGDTTLSEFTRPIQVVPEQASVSDALDIMLKNREHILLVVDEYGGVEGIVTLEDVIETLLGVEIVDESDTTADLQELARRLARRKQSHDHMNVTSSDETRPPDKSLGKQQ